MALCFVVFNEEYDALNKCVCVVNFLSLSSSLLPPDTLSPGPRKHEGHVPGCLVADSGVRKPRRDHRCRIQLVWEQSEWLCVCVCVCVCVQLLNHSSSFDFVRSASFHFDQSHRSTFTVWLTNTWLIVDPIHFEWGTFCKIWLFYVLVHTIESKTYEI